MRERIRGAMARAFGVALDEVPEDAALDRYPRWDSLAHIQLMLELEAEFALHLPSRAMLELLSIEAIERFLLAGAAR